MNLTLSITPFNASAIPATWVTIHGTQFSSATQACWPGYNRLAEPVSRMTFTRAQSGVPEKAARAATDRDFINELVTRIKDKFGISQAKHLIQYVGQSDKLMDIEPDCFPYIIRACQYLQGCVPNSLSESHLIYRFTPEGHFIERT